MTELISVAKYSSNDRPHTGREEGKEDQRKVKVKSNLQALNTTPQHIHENMHNELS